MAFRASFRQLSQLAERAQDPLAIVCAAMAGTVNVHQARQFAPRGYIRPMTRRGLACQARPSFGPLVQRQVERRIMAQAVEVVGVP